MDPRVQGKVQGREKQLFTPTSPSTHSLLVLFLTAFRWLPVSRQIQKGEVDTELIFASFLKGGRCRDPSADNTASRSQKSRSSFLLPTSTFLSHVSVPHTLSGGPWFCKTPLRNRTPEW